MARYRYRSTGLRRLIRRRLRRLLRGRPGRVAASAIAAGLVVAAVAGHHQAGDGSGAATRIHGTVPDGISYTPRSWAVALVAAGGWPQTACNDNAITAWEDAEGGAFENDAEANPLDTTQPEPGSQAVNPVGVQAYPSWSEGFQATLATLANGDYGAILSALTAGDDAQAVADAVAGSPWGTGPFTASC
jgi:hypothetical protein